MTKIKPRLLNLLVASVLFGSWATPGSAENAKTSTEENVVKSLEQKVLQLNKRLEEMEKKLEIKNSPSKKNIKPMPVTLEQADYNTLTEVNQTNNQSDDFISSRWFENFDITGFGGFSYIETGEAGKYPTGGFSIKEASLFVEADAWQNTSVFFELQTNRLGDDGTKWVRTGEVYLHMRDLFPNWQASKMGIKIGRMDLPFGEEYLFQDAIDNPLISASAAYPYGWDEGILLYGDYQGLGWVASIMDGTDARSNEDHSSKAINAKLWGNPIEPLYLSASFMHNGKAAKSALEFGGSHFRPVGASHVSTLGSSSSELVESWLWEVDAKYSFGETGDSGYLWMAYGSAEVDDDDSTFDRDIRWLIIEPLVYLTDTVYLVARYSEIGTFDDELGYHFDGKIIAGGNGAFGYDVKSLERLSFGFGWWINQKTNLKIEFSEDDFELINSSPFSANNNERNMFALEITTGF